MSNSWEKPFHLSEIHQNVNNWSLSSDAKLLLLMKEFSKDVLSSVQQAGSNINVLAENSETICAKLANVCNNFSALSSSQFIENRVDENMTDKKNPDNTETTVPDAKAKEESAVMERCTEALQIGLATLDSQFQRVDIAPLTATSPTPASASANNVTEIPKSSIFVPINPYASRRLPALIGSQPFFADDYCGLFDPNNIANTENVSAVYTNFEPQSFSPPPPPPPPLPDQSISRNSELVVSPENDSVSSPESPASDDEDFQQRQNENVSEAGTTSTLRDVLRDELFGKYGRLAPPIESGQDEEENDDGDLFSSRTPLAVTQTKRPVPAEEPLNDDSKISTISPVNTESKLAQLSSLHVTKGNSLFDDNGDEDEEDSLFSGVKGKAKTSSVLPDTLEVRNADAAAASKLLFREDKSITDSENASGVMPNIRQVEGDNVDEQMFKVDDLSTPVESSKPSRCESVENTKKLPSGAVSLFGASAKADPLAEALRSRLGIVNNAAERNRSTSGASSFGNTGTFPVISSTAPQGELPTQASTNPPPPETFERISSNLLPPNAISSASSTVRPNVVLFAEEDEEVADLFAVKPLASQRENNVPIVPSKQATLLFTDDDEDQEGDLFGPPPKPKVLPEKQTMPLNKSAPRSNTQHMPTLPSAPGLFDDDDDDDDDLFSYPKKTDEFSKINVKTTEPDDSDLFSTTPVKMSVPSPLVSSSKSKITVETISPSPAVSDSGRLKAAINPLTLLPGARPPRPAEAQIARSDTDITRDAPIQPAVAKKQKIADIAEEAGSLFDFDKERCDKQVLSTGTAGRVNGPRRNRPSRWAVAGNSQASSSALVVASSFPADQPEHPFIDADHPLASADKTPSKPSVEVRNPESHGKSVLSRPKLEVGRPSLFNDDDDDGSDLFGGKPISKQHPNTAESAKQTSSSKQSLFDKDVDSEIDDIFHSATSSKKEIIVPTPTVGPIPTKVQPLPELPARVVDVDDIFA